jgi:flavorubredoxin
MHALVVYESMFGNTHAVANDIADGLRPAFDVTVVPVGEATDELVAEADLLVCGGPTHAHGLSGDVSRRTAMEMAAGEGSLLALDHDASGPGLRDWFHGFESRHRAAAAFDTRFEGGAGWSGRASLGIAQRLRRHGFLVIAPPESFVVDEHNHLRPGEAERATKWGASVAVAALER